MMCRIFVAHDSPWPKAPYYAEASENSLMPVSGEAASLVAKNFLNAAAAEKALEIKTLQPLIYRHNIRLIETCGAIMIFQLDLERILNDSIPIVDIPLFQLFLHQTAAEIASQEKLGVVFLDDAERICCLVDGMDEAEITAKSSLLYEKTSRFIQKQTTLTLTASLGSPVRDVHHLHLSCQNAGHLLKTSLFSGCSRLVQDMDPPLSRQVEELEQSVEIIWGGILENNEWVQASGLQRFVQFIPLLGNEEICRFGLFLIESLTEARRFLHNRRGKEEAERALACLSKELPEHSGTFTHADVIRVYTQMLHAFQITKSLPDNETGIVMKAKEYIYNHYAEPLRLAVIAKKVGVSSAYLSDLFHKEANESYIKFLTRLRMEKAAQLLSARPAQKIYDVARKVGYSSTKHFSYVFKQFYGTPPGEYQEIQQKKP